MTRTRLFEILEGGDAADRVARAFNQFMIVLILLNVGMVVLESMPAMRARFAPVFFAFELFSVAVFSIEYALRLAVITEHPQPRFRDPVRGRIRFALTPLAIIDLLAILPFFLGAFGLTDLRFLRAFRLLRLLKLARYFPALRTLGNVLAAQRRALLSASVVMLFMLVVCSSVMYLIERDHQPDAFGSIPAAMWWGIATLTTVGYGDVVPVTPLGRIMGTFIAMFGIGMFALPAAMLASGFSRETDKEDFLASWHLVAAVPVFGKLDAVEIARVAELLDERTAVPNEIILRVGSRADRMYFLVRGTVAVELPDRTVELTRGDFFGEMALLGHTERVATVRAVSSCRFLVLKQADFEELCEDYPQLAARIEGVAAKRRAEIDGQ
ncbi:MAG: cyclic nucleotide-gated ion channel [Pseudomonadota bacterium]